MNSRSEQRLPIDSHGTRERGKEKETVKKEERESERCWWEMTQSQQNTRQNSDTSRSASLLLVVVKCAHSTHNLRMATHPNHQTVPEGDEWIVNKRKRVDYNKGRCFYVINVWRSTQHAIAPPFHARMQQCSRFNLHTIQVERLCIWHPRWCCLSSFRSPNKSVRKAKKQRKRLTKGSPTASSPTSRATPPTRTPAPCHTSPKKKKENKKEEAY